MTTARAFLPRRVAVTLCYFLAVAGSAVGVGAFGGTPIAEAAGGLLATDATHLAPASPAFSIWTVIYIGLGAYTLWQWFDADRRRVTWLAGASMLLNAAWILVVQAGGVWASVGVIVLLLAVLAELFRRTVRTEPGGALEAVVTDGTFGLYLGWVCVATCANIAAALTGAGFTGLGRPGWLAAVILLAAGALGVALTTYGKGRLAVTAALAWGLAWIAVARVAGQPESLPAAVAAVAAAAAVVLVTLVLVRRRVPATRAG